MAISKLFLRHRCSNFQSSPPNRPNSHRFFSSFSKPDPNAATSQPDSEPESKSQTQNQTPFSSYLRDVKASLQKEPLNQNRSQIPRSTFSVTNSNPQTPRSLEEISNYFSDLRRRSDVPLPSSSATTPSSHSGRPLSFQEIYKRNVIPKTEDPSSVSTDSAGRPVGAAKAGGILSMDAIKKSLKDLTSKSGSGRKPVDSMSLSRFKESFKLKPVNPNPQEPQMIVGSDSFLSDSKFVKDKRDSGDSSRTAMKTVFVRKYTHKELGEKLNEFRPEKKGNWFSLQELNERLLKVRENEDKESEARIAGLSFADLRESLSMLRASDEDKAKKNTMQKLDILGSLGGTPSFMLSPPKEHLVEKYFHPDNMSSAEKLALELKKVRDEFKTSESDCGSARVQVAQLTTKIKHLQNVLHKKDKHSRRGLELMVERRKKLVRYLRQTDFDSYCEVISKLDIRDQTEPQLQKYMVRRERLNLSGKKQKGKKGKKKTREMRT